MSDSIKELIDQLDNPALRTQAGSALLQLGADAVDGLLASLSRQSSAQVMRLLYQIADPRALDAFHRGLLSDDEDIRAISARGLHRLGAAEALQAALNTIDDAADPLHADMTPSVRTLIELGLGALSSVLPLLDAEKAETRQHAQKVFENVTYNMVLRHGNSYQDQVLETWQAQWAENGNYDWAAPKASRAAAIVQLRRWLEHL